MNPTSNTSRPVSRSNSHRDKRNEPTGLHVLHQPDGQPAIDIIFVHGLDGSSQLSWSWKRDLSCFWPKEWLPQEPELHQARILTFGYNAFYKSHDQDIFNISAFSKQLLMQMKFGTDGSEPLRIGKAPLMFVVHSMGGLVVKKALILGLTDPEYSDILESACSIIFLATPHRGSGLAEVLNKYLLVTFQSPKKYVSDLQRNSPGIEDINDQFRHYASRLQIVSFFETLPSHVGPKKFMVVERDSAILGYFNEISAPLNANHAHVSKYPSPEDPNYTTVKNVIKSMVERFRRKQVKQQKKPSSSMLSHTSLQSSLETLLNMFEPQSELETLLELYVEGTSDWLLDVSSFEHWLEADSSGPSILHITGHAGAGKSVTAAFLARHLEECGRLTQFFFFRFDSQQTGKSIRHCLLSLAYQLALVYPEYGRRLKAMLEDRKSLANADARRLWQKAFVGIFAKLELMEPIYWVIDALDESESVQTFLNLLPGLKTGGYPVHIIFFTRPHTIGRVFDRLKTSFEDDKFVSIEMSTPKSGLELYIHEELQFVTWPGDQEFMDHITNSLLEKCRGNFLWLRLVLKELTNCDYPHEALAALNETPPELAAVYHRIQAQLVKDMRRESKDLAIRVLSWIACSDRQLTLDELAEGLKTQDHTAPMLHPQQTISRLCGDLVTIDTKTQTVSMVHHTAKEFITQSPDSPLYVNTIQAHSLMLRRCLDELTDPKFRLRIKTEGCRGFLQYAVSAWSYHLSLSNERDDDMIASVAAFLQNNAVLCWIDATCQLGQLRILTTAAKNMNTLREKRQKFNEGIAPNLHCEEELEVMEQWSKDLVRIVGKFGRRLTRHPSAIYTLIPPLCPPESALSRYFFNAESTVLRVSGQKRGGWDDCLASFSVGHDCQPTAITVLEDHFAVHTSDEKVTLYTSSIFQELHQFDHAEVIVAIAFSQEGDKLVTCGFKTVKLWDVLTARLLDCFPNPTNIRAVAAALHSNSKIILCCTDGSIRSQQLGSPVDWKVTHRDIAADGSLGPGSGTPAAVAFSPDATKLALVFRGRWLGLWSVETGRLIGRCQRHTKGPQSPTGGGLRAYPQRLTWNPIHEHVIGLYNDGTLFKWNPVDPFSEELEGPVKANEVACSPDGRFLVTAATNGGSLHVWQYDSLRLIYHLACASPVTALAVGSDSRRLYDLRESFCNVWAPNSLIRLAESDEKSSETSSNNAESAQISLTSEFRTAISDPVTALAIARTGSTCCFATDNGDLTLRTSTNDDEVTVESGFFGATHLAFNHEGTKVACVEIEGSITLRSTITEDPLANIIQFNPGGIVQQLLFNKRDSALIIKTPDKLSLWNPQTGDRNCSRSLGNEDYWLELHPVDENLVIAFLPTAMRAFSLEDLSLVGSWNMDLQKGGSNPMKVAPIASRRPFSKYHMGHSDAKSLVGKGFSTPDQRHVFLQLVHEEPQTACSNIDFFLLDLSTPPTADEPVSVKTLPPAVLASIEIPLGFVEDTTVRTDKHSLAFLDSYFWVCSWSLGDTKGDRVRRHFFLPNDWINLDCLDMAVVTPDGRFVCPRNGEVAVISGGFSSVWIE